MLRGVKGAFGGDKINDPWIWGAFCAVFLIGLGNFRRPLSLRNLDLHHAALADGVALVLQPRQRLHGGAALLSRARLGRPARDLDRRHRARLRRRGRCGRPGCCSRAAVFLAGFRVGLNVEASNVIDVGYSGVIGAQRIVSHGQAPWGNFPVEDGRPACGPADSSGEIRNRIQTNGRCESANPQGDTYGPTAYEAYIPGFLAFGWSGKWDTLPAVHFTSILFDLSRCSGSSSSACASGARDSQRCSRSRGRRTRSRSTRRTRTRTTRSCRACSSSASGSRRRRPVAACSARCRVEQVRVAHRRAVVGDVSRPASVAALHRSAFAVATVARLLRHPARTEPGARATRLLGSHGRVAARP